MTTLSIRNQELESEIGVRDLSDITDGLVHGSTGISNVDIREINNATSFLYAANNLVISLTEPAGTAPLTTFSSENVRINGFWKFTNHRSDGTDFSQYRRFNTRARVVLFSPTRIVVRISDEDSREVEEYFRSIETLKPEYGMLTVVVPCITSTDSTVVEHAYLIKYTHNPLYSAPVIPSIPAPFLPSENVYRSVPYSSETLFVPHLSSSFVYNFYEPRETEYDLYNSRNYRTQKLSDIPKYIRLTWNKPNFSRTAFERENTTYSAADSIRPPSFESDTGTPSTAVRMGGMVLSTAGQDQVAEAMGTGTRTAAAAAATFDGTPSISDADLDTAGGTEGFLPGGGYVDDFATGNPRGELTINHGNYSDYVGYVIEKSRYTEDGSYETIDLIAIEGKDGTEFIDWKIAYGEVYRYRIRSIFRFYNVNDLLMFFDSDDSLTRNQTTTYVDRSLIPIRKVFYFDSSFSDPEECETTEIVRPNAPVNVRLFASSYDRKIFITWSQKNQNRDIVGFNVYKRAKNDENIIFSRVNSQPLDIRNNFYFDYDIEVDVDYLYTIESIDFHGNFSPLSAQYFIRTTSTSPDVRICEAKQKFYDIEGRELGEFKVTLGANAIIFKRNFAININPLFKNADIDDTFVLRATSLDTGQKKEIKLNFRTLTIYHSAGYVPAPTGGFLGNIVDIADAIRARNYFFEDT